MSGTLIWLFRHLEHQNPSIISGDIGRASWMQNLGQTDTAGAAGQPLVLYRIDNYNNNTILPRVKK